jgi:hypothetical protein
LSRNLEHMQRVDKENQVAKRQQMLRLMEEMQSSNQVLIRNKQAIREEELKTERAHQQYHELQLA